MIIRKAEAKDATEITELRKNSFEKINGEDYPRELLNILNKKNTPETIIKKMKQRDMFCLIDNNKIIARAGNKIYSTKDRLAHAEAIALKECQSILWKPENKRKAIIYTTYAPCIMCFGIAVHSRVSRIVYGANLDDSGCCHLLDSLPGLYRHTKADLKVTGGIMEKECGELFLQSPKAEALIKEGLIKPEVLARFRRKL